MEISNWNDYFTIACQGLAVGIFCGAVALGVRFVYFFSALQIKKTMNL